MRYLVLAFLTLTAGGLHADTLSDARKATQADIDALEKKYPEVADYTKVSSTWETGKNGWDDLQKLFKAVDELDDEEEDWWWTFKSTPNSPKYTEEEIDCFKLGVAATDKLAGEFEKLLGYDCFLPPKKKVLDAESTLMISTMKLFNVLERRVTALSALNRQADGLKNAELVCVLARKMNMGGTMFDAVFTGALRTGSVGSFLRASLSADNYKKAIARILEVKPLRIKTREIWLGELSFCIASAKDLLSKNDDELKASAKARNDRMGTKDKKCTPKSILEEPLGHLKDLASVIEALPKDITDTSNIKSAEVLAKAVESTKPTPDAKISPIIRLLASQLVSSDAGEQAAQLALRIRQIDESEISIEETKKRAAKILESFSGLTLKWEGANASIWFNADHPVHKLSDTPNDDALMEFEVLGKK